MRSLLSLAFAASLATGAGPTVSVRLALDDAINTRTARIGDLVHFRAAESVWVGALAIPAGTAARGTVVHVTRPGRVRGRAALVIGRVALDGPNGPIMAASDIVLSPPASYRHPPSEAAVRARILLGMVVGYATAGLASHWSHSEETVAGAGLAAGASTVVLSSVLSRGPQIRLVPGTLMDVAFETAGPVR